MGGSALIRSIERLKLVMAERKVQRLAGLLVLVAMGLLVSDVAAGGNDAHESPPVVEEIQEQGISHEAVEEHEAPKHVHKQAGRHPHFQRVVAAKSSPARAAHRSAHAKVMAAAKHHVKMASKKVNTGKALKKIAQVHKVHKTTAKVMKKTAKAHAKRHRILGPPPPKPVPHPHPLPGAPRTRSIRIKHGLPKDAKGARPIRAHVFKPEEEELVEDEEDEDEDEDELDRQEAEDEKAATQEELAEVDQELTPEKRKSAPTETPAHAPAAPKRSKHEQSTLAMIQSLKVPKAHRPAKPQQLTQGKGAVRYIDAKKYNINKNAARADATETAAVMDMAGLDMGPHLYKKGHISKFFKDNTWKIGASESFGGFSPKVAQKSKKLIQAARGVKDFAASDNKETSAMSELSYANQKRVAKGKAPTKFLQEAGVERGRDPPHGDDISNPRFRSMRGLYRAQSDYARYKKAKAQKANKILNKLAGIKNGRFYDHDGDKSDSDAASGLLH